MTCKKCGATLDDNAGFCVYCGEKLAAAEENTTAEPMAEETVATETVADETMTAEPAAEEAATEEPTAEETVRTESFETQSYTIDQSVFMPAAPQKTSIFKKWWFWLAAGFVAIGLIFGIMAAAGVFDDGGSGGGSGSSGSSSSSSSYQNYYVTLVKTAKHSTYGITYGAAFNDFFSGEEWSYFKATTGEHVVEFEGGFYYDGSPATAKIQFIVDTSEGTLQVYHLSINGVAQSKLVLAALVKKVFESY